MDTTHAQQQGRLDGPGKGHGNGHHYDPGYGYGYGGVGGVGNGFNRVVPPGGETLQAKHTLPLNFAHPVQVHMALQVGLGSS